MPSEWTAQRPQLTGTPPPTLSLTRRSPMSHTPSAVASPKKPGILARLAHAASSDAFGGVLLLVAAACALIAANSPLAPWYEGLRDFRVGPTAPLDLHLTVGTWAADGLLVFFFFVVGLELKEEFVYGRLRNPRAAAVPIAAAFGGVAAPALIFVAVNASTGGEALSGWAIPAATDIAFAVAVLAVVGRYLPIALRIFLLTLAIVDDLIAIAIIAIFYTAEVSVGWLFLSLVPLALFGLAVQFGVRKWWVLMPLAAAAWLCVHESGIHATVCGVLLGFLVPVKPSDRAHVVVGTRQDGSDHRRGIAPHFAERWGLFATLIAVPVFAFFSAGVSVGGWEGFTSSITSPIALGVILGLACGKPIGILSATFIMNRLPMFSMDATLKWPDLVGMTMVAGIGFTVSLLVGDLAYTGTDIPGEYAKIGVLTGSLVAGLLGAAFLTWRNSVAKRAGALPMSEQE